MLAEVTVQQKVLRKLPSILKYKCLRLAEGSMATSGAGSAAQPPPNGHDLIAEVVNPRLANTKTGTMPQTTAGGHRHMAS